MTDKIEKMSLLQPFRRHPRYRNLYIANFISNCGTWAQDLAVSWLMASLGVASVLVASVQTAAYLPVFLFAVFAGTLADLVDRPKYMMIGNILVALVGLVFTVFLLFGCTNSWMLLTFVFLMGIGTAFLWPAWQAASSSLVEHHEIPTAVTLNSLALNLSTVIGPAIGGLLYKISGGPTPLVFFNTLSFVALIIICYRWGKSPHDVTTSTEKFKDAFINGFSIILKTRAFNILLLNTFVLLFGLSSFRALLPLAVKHNIIGAKADTYGFLLGALGVGAAVSAFLLPMLRARFSTQTILSIAAIIFAFMTLMIAMVDNVTVLLITIAVGGFAWISVVSTLNAVSQTMFPLQLRARAISLYLVIMSGGTAFGSVVWGWIADLTTVNDALTLSAVFLLLLPWVIHRWKVVIHV